MSTSTQVVLPKHVFITGANGFIGRALAARYRHLGAEVCGIVGITYRQQLRFMGRRNARARERVPSRSVGCVAILEVVEFVFRQRE